MSKSPNKSYSESDMTLVGQQDKTPPTYDYVTARNKRKRNEDIDYDAFKEEIRNMFQSFIKKQEHEAASVGPSIKDIRQSIGNIESAMTLISAHNEELKNKLDVLESERKKDREYIAMLEDKLEDMNRQNKKTLIEIRNVPYKPNETQQDLLNMAVKLAKTVNYTEFSKNHVKDIFRVKKKENNNTLVVELQSTMLKRDILAATKSYNYKNKTSKLCARHLGITEKGDTPVYISEQLTPKAARLYFLARDLAKSQAYKFCWTAFGKVNVRKDEKSPIIHITSEVQVQRLLNTSQK